MKIELHKGAGLLPIQAPFSVFIHKEMLCFFHSFMSKCEVKTISKLGQFVCSSKYMYKNTQSPLLRKGKRNEDVTIAVVITI